MKIALLLFALLAGPVLQEQKRESGPTCIKHLESLVYNPVARAGRVEGDVVLEVHISERGDVIGVLDVSGYPILSESAGENIRRWKFNPGSQRTMRLSYQFRLQGPEVYENVPAKLEVEWPDRILITSNTTPRMLD